MLKLFWFVFWAGLSLLAIAAGVSLRTRVRHASDAERPLVDDDAVRAILETGRLITSDDEPLDIAVALWAAAHGVATVAIMTPGMQGADGLADRAALLSQLQAWAGVGDGELLLAAYRRWVPTMSSACWLIQRWLRWASF